MTLPRRDPYLWIHLAGLATVPLWLDICLSGLAVGDPMVPPWVELTALLLIGTVPILWMQLQQPFYIFSIPGLAVRPDKLTEDRRRLLTIQRGWLSRLSVVLGASALGCLLYWLYQLAPIAADMTPFAGQSRTQGWLICAIAFLFANLFVQVPATVIPLLLASSRSLERTPPYEAAAILQDFSVVGLRVSAILPDLAPEAAATVPTIPQESVAPAASEAVEPATEGVSESLAGADQLADAIQAVDLASLPSVDPADGAQESLSFEESDLQIEGAIAGPPAPIEQNGSHATFSSLGKLDNDEPATDDPNGELDNPIAEPETAGRSQPQTGDGVDSEGLTATTKPLETGYADNGIHTVEVNSAVDSVTSLTEILADGEDEPAMLSSTEETAIESLLNEER